MIKKHFQVHYFDNKPKILVLNITRIPTEFNDINI